MAYQVETALKRRMRACGITVVSLAGRLGMPPPTLSNQLNGYAPVSNERRSKICKILEDREKELDAEERAIRYRGY